MAEAALASVLVRAVESHGVLGADAVQALDQRRPGSWSGSSSAVVLWDGNAQKTPQMVAVLRSMPGGLPMARKSEGRSVWALREATGLIAVLAAQKAMRVGWRRITGNEPPASPDDQQVPLRQAVAWTLLLGAAIATARLFAHRYASYLLSRSQRQAMAESPTKRSDTPTTSA